MPGRADSRLPETRFLGETGFLSARWRTLGLRERLLAYLVVFWVLPALIGVGVILVIQRHEARADAIRQLEGLVNSRQALVQDWWEEALGHAEEIAGLVSMCSPRPGRQTCDPREVLALEARGEISEISLLDPVTGQVVLSSDPAQEGKMRAGQDYFRSGLTGPSLSPIFYDLALDAPTQVASAPVRDWSGEVMGVVALRLDVGWLDARITHHTGLGDAGDVYLVNRDGFLLTPSRYEAGGILRQAIFSEGVTRALTGESGWAFYNDFRGVPVLGVYRWLPEADMALLAEMDRSTVFREQRAILLTTLAVGIAFLLAGVGGTASVSRHISRPLTDLVVQAARMAAGELDVRVSPLHGGAELERLGRAFNEMATAVQQRTAERERAEEALRRRAEELAALHAISLEIIVPHDLPTLLHTIVQRAARLLDVPSGTLFLCDPERQEGRCVVSYNTVRDYTGTVHKYGEGATGIVAQTGEPLIIDDYRIWSGRAAVYEEDQPFRAVLSVPMIWQGQVTGVIHLLHNVETRRFTQADLELLTLFANQAAIAVENARLLEAERAAREQAEAQAAELRSRERNLTVLNDITCAAVEALEFQAMLQTLADRMGELINADGCYIALWDEEQQRAIPAAADGPLRDIYPTIRVEPGEVTMTESVLRAGHALVAEDVFNSPYVSPRIAAMFPARSLLGLPLIADGQKLGAALIGFNQPHRFTPEEIALSEQAARQIALAVAKARLLEKEREQRQEAQQRARRQAALVRLSADLAATLDEEEICHRVVQGLHDTLGYAYQGVFLVDEATGDRVLRAGVGWPDAPTDWRIPPGQGVSERALLDGQLHYTPDVTQDPRYVPGLNSGAEVDVPIRVGGKVVGVLVVESQEPNAFSPEDFEVLEAAANQAGIAISNARLLQVSQRRAQEAETLRQAGAVVAATLQQDEAIQRILEQLERVVPYDSASVQLLRDGYVEIVGGRGWADPTAVVGLRFPVPADNPNTVVIQERRPYILGDAPAAYAPFIEEPHSHIRSWLGVPLIVHDQVIGMLAVDSTQPNHFTQNHARLATAFANQVAIALENARLFEAERRRSEELEALHQASLRLTSSLDLQPVLEAILQHALRLVNADDAHIFLYDGERLIFGTALWTNEQQEQPYTEPRSDGLTYTVARSGEPIVIPDVNRHPLFRDWQWGGAIVGLPLRIGGQVCGVLNVAFERPHAFDENELRVLELLADQAAIVIRNAQLHAEVQKLAMTDSLTGLYNRRGFFELGQREVERAHRFGRPLAAMMFDLDHFKQVNDTYGHAIGDQVLVGLAARCRQELREVDLLGRYGGEEFVALLPETHLAGGRQAAERLRQVVSQQAIVTDEGPVKITISVGVVALDEACNDVETLVERADQALYGAKQAGRNRVSVWQGSEEQVNL